MVVAINNNSQLSVRFAKKHDVAAVMKYIAEWKNGHILSHDQELFEYMYLGSDDDVNFVIASEISTGRVVAILGFIPTNTSRSRAVSYTHL